ncbi:MAG TPA: zinc ribbon domain-containing protein [Chloroflexota bacterium]|nr:zinc ribbon domain-containing protein [Chloroflexota bacterium]
MHRKSFKYRLYPTPAQERVLRTTLSECRWLYNQLLEERKTAYIERGETLSYYHCLAKSNHDAAWRQYIALMTYKAAWAGRRVIAVNPAYTSQDCSGCGHRERKELSQRVHRCSCCGLILDRDHNAALNILAVGLHSLAHA